MYLPSDSLCLKVQKTFTALRLFDHIICVTVLVCGFLIGRKVSPFCRPFSWDDERIGNTFAKREMFPSWTLLPIAVLPVFVYIVVEAICAFCLRADDTSRQGITPGSNEEAISTSYMNREDMQMPELRIGGNNNMNVRGERRRECVVFSRKRIFLETVNHWILAQLFSVALCIFIIDLAKVFTGRLRPDFLDRLRREGYNASSKDVNWCKVAREGRLSFPSGHSGISFASIVPLVLFSMGHLRVFRYGSIWGCFLSLILLFLPIIVAISRTRDNRHFFSDILCGSIIGTFCALLSVKLLFSLVGQTGMLIPRRIIFSVRRGMTNFV